MAGDRIFRSVIDAALSLKIEPKNKESNPNTHKGIDSTLKFTEDINTLFPVKSLITLLYTEYGARILKDHWWQKMKKNKISEATFAYTFRIFLFCYLLTKKEVIE